MSYMNSILRYYSTFCILKYCSNHLERVEGRMKAAQKFSSCSAGKANWLWSHFILEVCQNWIKATHELVFQHYLFFYLTGVQVCISHHLVFMLSLSPTYKLLSCLRFSDFIYLLLIYLGFSFLIWFFFSFTYMCRFADLLTFPETFPPTHRMLFLLLQYT